MSVWSTVEVYSGPGQYYFVFEETYSGALGGTTLYVLNKILKRGDYFGESYTTKIDGATIHYEEIDSSVDLIHLVNEWGLHCVHSGGTSLWSVQIYLYYLGEQSE